MSPLYSSFNYSFGEGDGTPRIVTNGLVLNLDAARQNSYAGSGTTWRDLSGNGNTGTLTNGPTYSSANGGALVFDGVNDYATNIAPSLTTTQIEGSLTYEYWIKANSTIYASYVETNNGIQYYSSRAGNVGLSGDCLYKYNDNLYSSYQFAFGTNGFVVGGHNNGFAPPILVSYASYPNTCQLVIIKTANGFSYYINGIFIRSSVSTSRIFGDSLSIIATSLPSGANFANYFNGTIYSYKLYNRALSAAEISQNFQALRGRYGV